MNRRVSTLLAAVAATLVCALVDSQRTPAQSGEYQAPSFYTAGGVGGPTPPLPAAPLAGGMPAAGGDAYMNAYGEPIVMPASYCPSCPPEYCGPYGGAGGPGGDPMAVDFGGYGHDQCGPHYFDVSAETVWLQAYDAFQGVGFFTSRGAGGAARFLNPEADFGEYDPGWQIAVRYDLGALSVLEATYMGLYDISLHEQVFSPDVANGSDFQLFSVYSNFGTGTLIPGIDDGQIHRIDYDADLQSTELSYRRYWVGHSTCISGTYLAGFRYFRFTDDFEFNSQGLASDGLPNSIATATRTWNGENDLLGFQVGGDAWMCVWQGMRIGCDGKAGVYNNRFEFTHVGEFSDPNAPDDFDVRTDGNQVAFGSEASASVVIDILPSWSIRGGYRIFYLNSLSTAENNINQADISDVAVTTQGHVVYHGFHGGFEYIW